MATTLTKSRLQEILIRALDLKDPRFMLEKTGNSLSGNIISESFKGKQDLQRQQLIWDALDAALGADSIRLVGTLLAYTPEEWDIDLDAAVSPTKKAG